MSGDLVVPDGVRGVVVFAHHSGSSPHDQLVAGHLQGGGFATLLLDLPSDDLELLATRLIGATRWLGEQPETATLPVGYFGASTGAAVALIAAAHEPDRISAVVSRGGRPDLARDALPVVQAPTLLIVGGNDERILELNKRALARLQAPARLAIVPNAGHLFEEPGTLMRAATLARQWFWDHLVAHSTMEAVRWL